MTKLFLRFPKYFFGFEDDSWTLNYVRVFAVENIRSDIWSKLNKGLREASASLASFTNKFLLEN